MSFLSLVYLKSAFGPFRVLQQCTQYRNTSLLIAGDKFWAQTLLVWLSHLGLTRLGQDLDYRLVYVSVSNNISHIDRAQSKGGI